MANDEGRVREAVAEISALEPEPHDGVTIDPETIRTETMREGDEYHGVRFKLTAVLGRARIPFALDFSFGDPVRSTVITLESVIDQPDVELAAYPLALNLAEKIVTAMQRRETSTRDRDFADLWSRAAATASTPLSCAITSTRSRPTATSRSPPLAKALAHMPDRQQPYAAMVARCRTTHRRRTLDGLAGRGGRFVDLADDHGNLIPLGPSSPAVGRLSLKAGPSRRVRRAIRDDDSIRLPAHLPRSPTSARGHRRRPLRRVWKHTWACVHSIVTPRGIAHRPAIASYVRGAPTPGLSDWCFSCNWTRRFRAIAS